MTEANKTDVPDASRMRSMRLKLGNFGTGG
jgi:hypothetical protein